MNKPCIRIKRHASGGYLYRINFGKVTNGRVCDYETGNIKNLCHHYTWVKDQGLMKHAIA